VIERQNFKIIKLFVKEKDFFALIITLGVSNAAFLDRRLSGAATKRWILKRGASEIGICFTQKMCHTMIFFHDKRLK
jgi:hypothetical protein